jgi:3-hydroxybutyrate dehydrogenase
LKERFMTDGDSKVAVVTGAASGIGLAIARLFTERGTRVICADVDAGAGQAAVAELVGARFLRADLSRSEDCQHLIEQVMATEGRVDMLVNNAGIQHVAPITQFAEEKWRLLIEIMLTAPFLLTQAVLPGMYAR